MLAALGWFEERRFIGRALRAEGHLAGIVEHEVRSLFGVDIELRPTVEFLARDGTLQRFEATVDIKRLGLGRDAPLGATLSAEVL
ncbi:MAG: hypothetical protein KDC14_08800, partial [Planctomycetes bacterium]|nr:hypothetical protein [Planctomycetota bacterium]